MCITEYILRYKIIVLFPSLPYVNRRTNDFPPGLYTEYRTIFLTDVVTFSHQSPPSWLWPLPCVVLVAPFPAPTSDAVSQL